MIWKDCLKLSEIASYSKFARASKAPPPPPPGGIGLTLSSRFLFFALFLFSTFGNGHVVTCFLSKARQLLNLTVATSEVLRAKPEQRNCEICFELLSNFLACRCGTCIRHFDLSI